MNQPKFSPYLGLLVAVLAVSFSAILIRLCVAPPFIIGFYRLFFASLFFFPVSVYQNKSIRYPLTKKEFSYCVLSGICLASHFAFWIISLTQTSIASATILVATQPLFTSFLAWLILKESLNVRNILALIISFIGIVIIGKGDFHLGSNALLGDINSLLAGFLAGAYFLVGRGVRKSVNITNYVTIVYSTAAICLALLCLIYKNPFVPYSTNTFFWFLMLALFPTIIGHSLFNWTLRYLNAHIVGMSIFVEPIITIILAYFIFRESPAITTYLGGALTLYGLYLTFSHPKIDPESSEILA